MQKYDDSIGNLSRHKKWLCLQICFFIEELAIILGNDCLSIRFHSLNLFCCCCSSHSGLHRWAGRSTHPEHSDRRANSRTGAHRPGWVRKKDKFTSCFVSHSFSAVTCHISFARRCLRAREDLAHSRDCPLQAVQRRCGWHGHHQGGRSLQKVSSLFAWPSCFSFSCWSHLPTCSLNSCTKVNPKEFTNGRNCVMVRREPFEPWLTEYTHRKIWWRISDALGPICSYVKMQSWILLTKKS